MQNMLRRVGPSPVCTELLNSLTHHRKPILKDDVDRYTNRIGILLEHLELMHGEVYEEAKEQAEEESQPV